MKYILLPAILCILASCSSETQQPVAETTTMEITVPSVESDSVEFKTYNLPAPTEIAEALRGSVSMYMKDEMVPLDIQTTTIQNKALIMGMYGVDIGYSIAYEQPQEALNYLEKVIRLGDDLQMMSEVNPDVIERFKRNMNNLDSTTVIVMGAFSVFQQYLKRNDEEKTGLYIFSGSFIEGLHLALIHHEKFPGQEMMNLIGQQKFFLQNLMGLLRKYEPDGQVMNQLLVLREIYEKIPVTYTVDDKGKREYDDITIPASVLNELDTTVAQIRSQFTGESFSKTEETVK